APPRVCAGGTIPACITEDELPKFSGWAVPRPKPGAEVRLWVEAGERQDPLLATWQYELGRTAALPIDFQAGGAAWPTWRGFAKLWSQLTMWAAPHGPAADRHLEARRLPAGTGGGGGGGGGAHAARGLGRPAGAGPVPRGYNRAPARTLKARAGARRGVRQLRRDSAPEADRPDGRSPRRHGPRARRTARAAPRARRRSRSSAR